MPRIQPLEINEATGQARELMEGIQKATGKVPNILKTMAHAPAALQAYLEFSKQMKKTSFSPAERELIAMTVGGLNNCDYCIHAHAFMGRKARVSDEELARATRGESGDPKTHTLLQFVKTIVDNKGWVDDDQLQQLRDAGYNDTHIMEIVAIVAMNILTNYVNHMAHTESDFPAANLPEPSEV